MRLTNLINDEYARKHSIESLVDLSIGVLSLPALTLGKSPQQFKKDVVRAIESSKMDTKSAKLAMSEQGIDSVPHNNIHTSYELDKTVAICQRYKEQNRIDTTQELYDSLVVEAAQILAIWACSKVTARAAIAQIAKSLAYSIEALKGKLTGHELWALSEVLQSSSIKAMDNAKIRIEASKVFNEWAVDAQTKGNLNNADVYKTMAVHLATGIAIELEDDADYRLVEELSSIAAAQSIIAMAEQSSNVNLITTMGIEKPKQAQWLLDNAEVLFSINKASMAEIEERIRLEYE